MKSSSNSPSDDVLGRSQDVFLRWSGRINRARFVAAFTVLTISGCLADGAMLGIYFGARQIGLAIPISIPFALHVAILILISGFLAPPIVQRAHDVGIGARAVIVWAVLYALAFAQTLATDFYSTPLLVPTFVLRGVEIVSLLGILALALPGQKGENRYGPPPAPVT